MYDPSAFQSKIEECAKPFNVSPAIHKEDFIFQFLMNNPSFRDKRDAINYYFSDAHGSARKFDELVDKFLMTKPAPVSVLEFASGFGCVSRHLKKFSPAKYNIVCSDIHPAAMHFISSEIGLETALSQTVPEQLSIGSKFDVVFALSFFSHMPDASWGRWLLKLISLVADDGLLIFTTHGRQSSKYFGNPPMSGEGYWFAPQSEQKDLSAEQYGSTIVAPQYVFSRLRTVPTANPLFFQEGFWWGHQDCYIVSSSPNWLNGTP